jgi:hypothetical protein
MTFMPKRHFIQWLLQWLLLCWVLQKHPQKPLQTGSKLDFAEKTAAWGRAALRDRETS